MHYRCLSDRKNPNVDRKNPAPGRICTRRTCASRTVFTTSVQTRRCTLSAVYVPVSVSMLHFLQPWGRAERLPRFFQSISVAVHPTPAGVWCCSDAGVWEVQSVSMCVRFTHRTPSLPMPEQEQQAHIAGLYGGLPCGRKQTPSIHSIVRWKTDREIGNHARPRRAANPMT